MILKFSCPNCGNDNNFKIKISEFIKILDNEDKFIKQCGWCWRKLEIEPIVKIKCKVEPIIEDWEK
jgi:hypothetical protein